MNQEELKAFLTKVANKDPENWKNIEIIAKDQGRKLPEVAEEMVKIFNEPFLAHVPEEERLVHVARIQYARLMQSFLIQGEPYEVYILDKTPAREITNKKGQKQLIASLYGIGRKVKGESDAKEHPIGFVNVVAFDKDAEKLQTAVEGMTYQSMFSGKFSDGIYNLNCDSKTNFESPVAGAPKLDPAEVLERIFKRVYVKQAGEHVSKSPGDLKMVKCNTIFSIVKPGKNGRNYGRYVVMDESQTPQEVQGGGGLSIMVDPSQVKYGQGTQLIILGAITKSEQYGVGMNGAVVIPVGIPVPFVPPEPLKTAAPPSSGSGEKAAEVVDFADWNKA